MAVHVLVRGVTNEVAARNVSPIGRLCWSVALEDDTRWSSIDCTCALVVSTTGKATPVCYFHETSSP